MESLKQLESLLDKYLGNDAPAMPADIKELIVKILPWLNLIGIVLAVLTLPILLAALGLSAMLIPFAAYSTVATGTGIGYMYSLAITAIVLFGVVLRAIAVPGLFSRAKSAWTLYYYAVLIGMAVNILHLLVIGIILSVVWLYVLFQIKSSYK